MQVIKAHDFGNTDFFAVLRRFSNFDKPFHVAAFPSKPVDIWVWFTAAIKHMNTISQAIDYSMHIGIRGPVDDPATFPTDPFCAFPTWIEGCVSAGNIRDPIAHYAQATANGYTQVSAPGWYRIEVWGKSVSDAAPGVHGLAEILEEDNVLNQLLIKVED